MKKPCPLPFVILLLASVSQALSLFPTLGYSSSTGFVLGGNAGIVTVSPDGVHRGLYSAGAFYGTAGMVSVKAEGLRTGPGGGFQAGVHYERLMGKKWFGWGNHTHPDTSTVMDLEKQGVSFGLIRGVLPGVFLRAGLSVRHSSVYNRDMNPLWEATPFQRYGSTWTGGPEIGVDYRSRRFGAGASFTLQAGDATYQSLIGRIESLLPLPAGLDLGLFLMAGRHFGVSQTPLPYAPALGQAQGFRGYSDFRFTGPVRILASAEVRRMLLEVETPLSDLPWQIGAAVFTDAGQVAEGPGDLSFRRFHWDAGAGMRILTHDHLMLKLDCGWGDEGPALSAGIEQGF